MKKIVSSLLVATMALSSISTVFATTNYTNGTNVEYENPYAQESYWVEVPSAMSPGDTATVYAGGEFGYDRQLWVESDASVILTNNINNSETKQLSITFDNLSVAGSNTSQVESQANIAIDDIENALFGTWSGIFYYDVEIVDYDYKVAHAAMEIEGLENAIIVKNEDNRVTVRVSPKILEIESVTYEYLENLLNNGLIKIIYDDDKYIETFNMTTRPLQGEFYFIGNGKYEIDLGGKMRFQFFLQESITSTNSRVKLNKIYEITEADYDGFIGATFIFYSNGSVAYKNGDYELNIRPALLSINENHINSEFIDIIADISNDGETITGIMEGVPFTATVQ